MSLLKLTVFCVIAISFANGFGGDSMRGKEYGDHLAVKSPDEISRRYTLYNEALTWPEAKKACEDKKMHLATPETYGQLTNLFTYLRNEMFPSSSAYHNDIWIGGTRQAESGTFVWISDGLSKDNTLLTKLYEIPDDARDCLAFHFHTFFGYPKWNHHYCTDRRTYVCEEELVHEAFKNEMKSLRTEHEETKKTTDEKGIYDSNPQDDSNETEYYDDY